MGVPPAAASAGVHTAETFTTAVSGDQPRRPSQCRLAAVLPAGHPRRDRRRARRLCADPGGRRRRQAVRARLSHRRSASIFSIAASCTATPRRRPRIVSPLGLIGGFLDAAGGGGWGGIVTSNLLVQGSNPRKTIGTRQHRRILPDRDHLRDLHRDARLAGVHDSHPRPADRRRLRRPVRRLDRQARQCRTRC